ncbi:DUF6879 family protein [Nonomuraea sp. NPDC004702]
MQIYPPSEYRQLSIESGGVDEFSIFFGELRSRWVKVECLQEYDESGFEGFEAFRAGNFPEAARLVREMVKGQTGVYAHMRKFNVSMIRIRVCELPLSSYLLDYEIPAYLADIECGEEIRFVKTEDVRDVLDQTGISDYVLFDKTRVTALMYDMEASTLREARLVESEDLVQAYADATEVLIRRSVPMLESPIFLEIQHRYQR